MKLLLFDIDQTLINSGGAGIRALDRACYKTLSLENAMKGISPHGKTDRAIIREILRVRLEKDRASGKDLEIRVTSILESYLSFLREEVRLSADYRVLPGVLSTLTELSTRSDVLLGLATGNVETGGRIKLDRGDLNRFFTFGGFGSDSENRSVLVQKAAEKAADKIGRSFNFSDVFVIGDTPLDIEAGRNGGFNTVGVATGSYSVDQLLEAGATIAISDLETGHDYFFRSTLLQ